MKTVTAIYTGPALIEPLSNYFADRFPEHRLTNVLDDSLIRSVIRAGKMTKEVLRKIYGICREAQASGSDLIFQTCSSVGKSAEIIQHFMDIPILRIDRPMAESAVRNYSTIAVLATLPTTLEPTMDLVRVVAEEQGKKIQLINGLAQGAFHALSSGDAELHDLKILNTAKALVDSCDAIILAQGSMARMADRLTALGTPVLASLQSGTEALRPYLEDP